LTVRPLAEQRRQHQSRRDDAVRRRNQAQQVLDRLGPIRRHTRPARRRVIEDRIARLDAEISGLVAELGALDGQLAAHAPAIASRSTWEGQHSVELRRLQDLDATIELMEQLDRIATRGVDLGVGRGLGVEL
jgi:hypothetical protein